MSYIPPHKRHSKDLAKPSPVPDSLVTKFKKKLDSCKLNKGDRIIYSGDSISTWFIIGSNGIKDEVPSYVKLTPLTSDSVERRNGEKPLVLMKSNAQSVNMNTGESEEERTKWLLVAEKVEKDLVLAYERAKKEMEGHHHVLRLAASFGKNFFFRGQCCPVDECSPKNSKKVSDYTRPNVTISCKCTLKEDGRLSMYKADINPVRHLVVDVSCIDKNLDMRLMLMAKRKLMDLSEKEISNIKALLDSATVDPNVKGALRWPFGKASSEDGYRVFEVCHVRATIYKNQSTRLRVRETDRFNERIGTGVIHREVMLMLKDMNTKLQEQNIEKDCVLKMLRETLGTIWDFLHCDAYLS